MTKLLTIFIFFVFTTNCYADWSLILINRFPYVNGTVEYFIHTDSVVNVTKNIKKFWVKTNYSEIQNIGSLNYNSTKEYFEVNCKDKKIRILAVSYFERIDNAGAPLLANTDKNPQWMYAAPESVGSALTEMACLIYKS